MTIDWLLRVGDGINFMNSSKYKIWGISTQSTCGKYFIKTVKSGDRLWFVQNKSHGQIIAVATYCSYNRREFGPLVNISMTSEELGWNNEGRDSDIEIHYMNVYGLKDCELLTYIKGPSSIRKKDEKCKVDLVLEYRYILKYSKITVE